MCIRTFVAVLIFCACTAASAHDTWVQTNSNVVRNGDSLYVDLMLGNHGNEHRDFKLANKVDLQKATLEIIGGENRHDLKPELVDRGYAPREGYWSGKFVPAKAGLYCVAHQLDTLHNTTHAIKSAKCFFIVSEKLDNVQVDNSPFAKPLGHPFELVPTANPVTPMGPGKPIAVKVLLRGKPLKDSRVSFIPRGAELTEAFDDRYERKTNEQGEAQFVPKEGNYVLVVAHHSEPEEKGPGFDRTSYSATLTVYVPDLCPCCE